MAHPPDLHRAPERAILQHLSDLVAPGSRPMHVRRLRGGLDTAMHAVDFLAPSGTRHRLVVKRFDPLRATRGPAVVCRQMWQTLHALAHLGLPAPRPVWCDVDGTTFGTPTLVMTRVPGRLVVSPRDPLAWAGHLATALATIHRTPRTTVDLGFLPDAAQRLDRWFTVLARDAAALATHPDAPAVHAMLVRLRPHLQHPPPVLTHGDFHPGNVLWWRGRLSGVVDWDAAAVSDPGADVGFCHMVLATQYADGTAEHFLHAYEQAVDGRVHQLFFWDLLAVALTIRYHPLIVANMHALGRSDITLEGYRQRLHRFIGAAVALAEAAVPDL